VAKRAILRRLLAVLPIEFECEIRTLYLSSHLAPTLIRTAASGPPQNCPGDGSVHKHAPATICLCKHSVERFVLAASLRCRLVLFISQKTIWIRRPCSAPGLATAVMGLLVLWRAVFSV